LKRISKRLRDEQGRFLSEQTLEEDLQETRLESLNFAQELIAQEKDEVAE
jgi:hypothetical protein